ncbi:MaoC/PaaZ C-terminal domain-containing protein [Psychromicrobium xiongbiense]|uniref:MaoC/PaaZ C-terminal domain-containing protein n=1 Tax=Psychromicrobium xiongbiense TaxID=3051184 RepID=UPI002555094B|nr:MaoC/PaaZ C-terminal domain-containing protein [Psychromicrobium sp. YIM S02556]
MSSPEETAGGTAAPSSVLRLQRVPELGALYAQAGRDAALGALGLLRRPRQFPGTVVVASEVRVDRARLEEFNRLMHGAGRDEVSAGLMHILCFPVSMVLMTLDDFPVPLLGLIHLRNRVEQRRRIDPDESFEVRVRVINPRRHRAGTQFDVLAEARDAAGELAWRGVSTYLSRGVRLDYPEAADDRVPFTAPDANAHWRLKATTGRDYAAVSGDVNPIHTTRWGARALGLKTTIAHGMYLASRALTAALPAGQAAYRWDIGFATAVTLPGSVAVRFTEQLDSGSWAGTEFQGWSPRSGKLNFSGRIEPLASEEEISGGSLPG